TTACSLRPLPTWACRGRRCTGGWTGSGSGGNDGVAMTDSCAMLLLPSFPRLSTDECLIKRESTGRHSREGGNPVTFPRNVGALGELLDSRLRGNDDPARGFAGIC